MLSNCKVKFETIKDISYLFQGESMLDYSKDSILDGDILKCANEDLLPPLIDGKLNTKAHDVFLLHLCNGVQIAAQIIDVKSDLLELKLRFLNPDKSKFPDQVLHFDDVMHVFKVSEVTRLLRSMNNLKPAQ